MVFDNKLKLMELFAGGGGFGIGAREAGLELAIAIEFDKKIADVYRDNLGDHVIVSRVQDINYKMYKGLINWVHSSNECKQFSVGNQKGQEGAEQISQAQATCDAITGIEPMYFTLENVWGYRKSPISWPMIKNTLISEGYGFAVDHVCFADFGVPQKRRRMIVRAIKGKKPRDIRMFHTHTETPLPLFGLKKWISWYSAIEDLIPALKEGKLPNWLKERIEDAGGWENCILGQTSNKNSNGRKFFNPHQPSPTVLATGPNPVLCITDNTSNNKIFISKDRQSRTIRAGKSTSDLLFSPDKVLVVSKRCLARLQAFPDWYKLPPQKTLAQLIIGNAVPPLAAKCIVESML